MHRRTLLSDTRGLSTVEYVILLLAIVCMGVAAWRMFGRSSFAHTERASGEMGSLDAPGGNGGGGGGGGHAGSTPHSHIDDATGDASPPTDTDSGLFGPGFLLAAGLVLVGAVLVRRVQQGGGKGSGNPPS